MACGHVEENSIHLYDGFDFTIGEVIDKTKEDSDHVMFTLRERKLKKQACDKDSLKKECYKSFGIDEQTFSKSITQLVNNGLVTENVRNGKFTYAPTTVQNSQENNESEVLFPDFLVFKKCTAEMFMKLDDKIEKQSESISNLGNIIEMKNTIISLLREEVENKRELLKMCLQRQNQPCISEQKSPQNVDQINKKQSRDTSRTDSTILIPSSILTPSHQ
jgi:hypothetical protein